MKKMYIGIDKKNERNAGSKAVNDCNRILAEMGFEKYGITLKSDGNKIVKKIHNGISLLKLFKVPKNALLVVPHPIYVNKKYMDYLKSAKKRRHLKLVFLIHDLDSVRRSVSNVEDFVWLDNTMYKIADYIISHNDSMTKYLLERGVKEEQIVGLKLFDYLSDAPEHALEFAPVLNIAGNLDTNKCEYLKELNDIDKRIKFKLYGVGFDKENLYSDSITYCGSFSPEELVMQLNTGFGLVWDGKSTCTCSGCTGEYLRYNNPHKLSLYIRSGMPVVIWREAAEAQFVIDNGFGLVVDSIEEFIEQYSNLKTGDYLRMCEKVRVFKEKVNKGYFLSTAVSEILDMENGTMQENS